MQTDIITQAETEALDTHYLPFIFKSGFPGFQRDFPNGASIVNVDLGTRMSFLRPPANSYPDAVTFNNALIDLFDQVERTKCFKGLSLKIAKNDQEQVQIRLFPKLKPFWPTPGELLTPKGLHLHFQLPNLLGRGERVTAGLLFNQKQYKFVQSLTIPFDDQTIKIKLQQNNLKSGKVILQERTDTDIKKSSMDFGLAYQQRFHEHSIVNGLGVNLTIGTKLSHIMNVFYNTKEKATYTALIWPSIGKPEFVFDYQVSSSIPLRGSTTFRGIRSKIDLKYSNLGLEPTAMGFKSLHNSKFSLTTNHLLFLRPHDLMKTYNLAPYLGLTAGYFHGTKDQWKGSLGLGMQTQIFSKNIGMQWNLLHFHGPRDKPLSFELLIH